MSVTGKESSVIPYEFGKKLFPREVDGKLNTIEFLEASNGIINLVSKLGSVFSPLYNDISCNIEKIKKCYDLNPRKYKFIEDLILCEKSLNHFTPLDALLWLYRGLHFTLVFFQNIIKDEKKSENLKEHMISAYSRTLEPYHGWVSRNLFKIFKNLVPKRSDLLSKISEGHKEDAWEKLIKSLQIYFEGLSENIRHLTSFFQRHNLDRKGKV